MNNPENNENLNLSNELNHEEINEKIESEISNEVAILENSLDKKLISKYIAGAAGIIALGTAAFMANKVGLPDFDRIDQGVLNNVIIASGFFSSWLAKYIIGKKNNSIIKNNIEEQGDDRK